MRRASCSGGWGSSIVAPRSDGPSGTATDASMTECSGPVAPGSRAPDAGTGRGRQVEVRPGRGVDDPTGQEPQLAPGERPVRPWQVLLGVVPKAAVGDGQGPREADPVVMAQRPGATPS